MFCFFFVCLGGISCFGFVFFFRSAGTGTQGYPASRKRPLSRANKYISSQLRCIIPREIAGIPAPVYFGAEISHPSRSAAPCGAEAGRAPPGAGSARAGNAGPRYRSAPGAERRPIRSAGTCGVTKFCLPGDGESGGGDSPRVFPRFSGEEIEAQRFFAKVQ